MAGDEMAIDATGIFPKYRRIADWILREIENDNWKAGEQLPSEDRLAEDHEVSIGTIQRSLRNLVDTGVLVRKHGKGTFVSGARAPREHLRHFRFLADDDRIPLPIYFEILDIKACNFEGPWAKFLKDPLGEYIRITRLASVAGEFKAFSEVLLPAGRFSRFLNFDREELDGISIRDKLAEEFNAPTLSARQTLQCKPLPPRVTQMIDQPAWCCGNVLTIEGLSYREAPVTWQRIFVPPSDRTLEISPALPNARSN